MDSGESNSKILINPFPYSGVYLFAAQIIIIVIVITTSIYNLTLNNGDTNLWTALLSSSIGYILPNPSLKPSKNG
jgi:hypothetical protein